MARQEAPDEEDWQRNSEREENDAMCPAKRLNHRCGFLSSGGSAVPLAQRRSRNGQRATEPGKIKTRKPTPVPTACESIRFTPTHTNATAKTTPSATYNDSASTNKTAIRSNTLALDRYVDTRHMAGPHVGKPQHQLGNIFRLNPFGKIRVRHGLSICRRVHRPRQNHVCRQSRLLVFQGDGTDEHRKSRLEGYVRPQTGMRLHGGQTANSHNSPAARFAQIGDRGAEGVERRR